MQTVYLMPQRNIDGGMYKDSDVSVALAGDLQFSDMPHVIAARLWTSFVDPGRAEQGRAEQSMSCLAWHLEQVQPPVLRLVANFRKCGEK